jgi:hypothetical protein
VKRDAKGQAKKAESSDGDSSEESSEEEEDSDAEEEEKEEAAKPAKKAADKPAAKKAKTGGDVDVSFLNGSKTVFVRNLPWSAGDDELRAFFADCGALADVRIAMDYQTNRPKGFAHVQFEELEGAAAACALSGTYMGDREIYIETTTERGPRESRLPRAAPLACAAPRHAALGLPNPACLVSTPPSLGHWACGRGATPRTWGPFEGVGLCLISSAGRARVATRRFLLCGVPSCRASGAGTLLAYSPSGTPHGVQTFAGKFISIHSPRHLRS